MSFGTSNATYTYRAGPLKAVGEEISKYKLHLMTVEEVRWDGGSTQPEAEYIFLYGKGNENPELGTGVFLRKGIISAVRRVEFDSYRISYIILRWSLV
jgi:hypothetical protein